MVFAFSSRSFLPLLLSLSIIICLSDGFHISNDTCYPSHGLKNEHLKPKYECELRKGKAHLVTLYAKKKRRRRRKESDTTSEDESEKALLESVPLPVGDELPDFDLEGEGEEASQRVKISSNPDEITPAMMADGNAAERSLDELITDRSLENKFEFDEPEDPNIPDFIQLAKESSSSSPSPSPSLNDGTVLGGGMGKKKQRQAERIANAIRVKEEEKKEGSNILSNIPSFLNEKGEVSGVKILEQGAWLGIYSLVGWEVYINSPLFDRAGPMAPIVYEILM